MLAPELFCKRQSQASRAGELVSTCPCLWVTRQHRGGLCSGLGSCAVVCLGCLLAWACAQCKCLSCMSTARQTKESTLPFEAELAWEAAVPAVRLLSTLFPPPWLQGDQRCVKILTVYLFKNLHFL